MRMDKKDKPRESIYSRIFQWLVIAIGGSLWVYFFFRLGFSFDSSALLKFGFFLVGVIAVSCYPVHITTPGMNLNRQHQLSISLAASLTFLILILQGPIAAIVIGGLDGLVASMRTVKRWHSNLFSLAMYAISLYAATNSFEAMMRFEEKQP